MAWKKVFTLATQTLDDKNFSGDIFPKFRNKARIILPASTGFCQDGAGAMYLC
ncbi:hypothetical protein LYNGBM3L_26170 [Moorena producens 3L]|uniref:Uncharacterized protein n=1 Tax=Moorena producens 3L TaxID=489825 RepID=F4XSW3_9CYAN|nr:hypothetical protein LYNGBM3L_26170 [Moorena producens 3L]